jgi:glycerol-3-phosphate dehydrogenase (NAD(P)+)
MRIVVLGAGAWGTAVAMAATRSAAEHRVWLCPRDPAQAQALVADGCNTRYLSGITLPETLSVVAAQAQALPFAPDARDLLILATPMAALRQSLTALADSPASVVWLCKGFESGAAESQSDAAQKPNTPRMGRSPTLGAAIGALGHEIAAQVAPRLRVGILSGPSFAREVAQGLPTALVAASTHASVTQQLVDAFHSGPLRVYANDDCVGVEVGGAVKNVLAIATGLCDGLGLGTNARAALITRGLAEMSRLGLALGARAETFMGLTGLGDLVLTATGDLSRNRKVGLLLAQGLSLEAAVRSLGHVAEGVYTARTVVQRARHLGVDMPIAQAVVGLLDGHLQPQAAVAALMGRDPRAEG